MEGALMLMLLTGFLAFIVYRMDQNEKNSEKPGEDVSEKEFWYRKGVENALRNLSQEPPIDVTPKAVRKKRK